MIYLVILGIVLILFLGVLVVRAYIKLEQAEYRLTGFVRENALNQLPAQWPERLLESDASAVDKSDRQALSGE
jgi:hypothetical protein